MVASNHNKALPEKHSETAGLPQAMMKKPSKDVLDPDTINSVWQ